MIRRTNTVCSRVRAANVYTPGGSPVSWGLSGSRAGSKVRDSELAAALLFEQISSLMHVFSPLLLRRSE